MFGICGLFCENAAEVLLQEQRFLLSHFWEMGKIWEGPVPRLEYLCLLEIANNFEKLCPISRIPEHDYNYLMEILPIHVDISATANFIDDEYYWKRCCKAKWPDGPFWHEEPATFWKRNFFSKYLQERIENTDPNLSENLDDLFEATEKIEKYIFKLKITKLMPFLGFKNLKHHFSLECFSLLTQLVELHLSFNVNNETDDSTYSLFKFSVTDFNAICLGLLHSRHFKRLRIKRCFMDEERTRTFCETLKHLECFEEFEISYTNLDDMGLIPVTELIRHHPKLKKVILQGNDFKENGLKYLAESFRDGNLSSRLDVLDLSRNTVHGKSIEYFINCFAYERVPRKIILSFCGISNESANLIALALVNTHRHLEEICLRSNNFSAESELNIVKSLNQNKYLLKIDLRNSGITEEALVEIKDFTSRNQRCRDKENKHKSIFQNNGKFI